MTTQLQDAEPFVGHSPQQGRPLGGYALLMGAYGAAVAGFGGWFRSTRRTLPERVDPADLALVTVTTHTLSRLIAKEWVRSPIRAPFTTFEGDGGPAEVSEEARGRGLRRALGELLVCPFCMSMWITTTFTAGLLVAPRLTRHVTAVLTALFGADLLQLGCKKAQDTL